MDDAQETHSLPTHKRRETLLLSKIKIAQGLVTERHGGVRNVFDAARALYLSLYTPQKLRTIYGDRIRSEIYHDRESTLSNTEFTLSTHPNEEEFIEAVITVLTRSQKISEAVYEGALPFIEDLLQYGKVRIWTQGDHSGRKMLLHPDGREEAWTQEGENSGLEVMTLKGSAEQLKKIILADIPNLRRKHGKEALDVISSEDKFAPLCPILEEAKTMGIQRCYIIEDRLANLIKAKKLLAEATTHGTSFPKLSLIWLQQGSYKNAYEHLSRDEIQREYSPALTYQEVLEHIKHISGSSTKEENLILVDFDGVLMDDKKRFTLVSEAVEQLIVERGWIDL